MATETGPIPAATSAGLIGLSAPLLSSQTANRVAMSRAVRQILDDLKVLDDPVAPRIIGAAGAQATLLASRQLKTQRLALCGIRSGTR
jgi:hypothetical protein